MFQSIAIVQQMAVAEQGGQKAAFFAIFSWLNTTGKVGKVTRKRVTVLNSVTSEHKPDPALKARMAMKQMLQDTQAAREPERLILAKREEERKAAQKAAKVEVDQNAKLFAMFDKMLKVDEKV